MALITLKNISLAFGHWPLLDEANLSLEDNERVGLIGRNGTGKSSLLKVIAGMQVADGGEIAKRQSLTMAYVAQEPELEADATIFDAVSVGLGNVRELRRRYEAVAMGEAIDETESLDTLQSAIDARDGWTWEQRVETTLSHLALDGTRKVSELSGGMKKRVALAQGLVAQPDVLLLDEPTNHLDMDAIEWLEGLLKNFKGSIMLITHDRAFLDNVATRIIELDRAKLGSFKGNYAQYEVQKEAQLAFDATVQAKSDKLLKQEEVWIRKGVEARRTRSVARIGRLEKLRELRVNRRNALGQVKLDIDAGARSGKLVAELTDVHKAFGERLIAHDVSLTVLRGDKIGLIGGNGVGKTTLLRMVLGELEPDSGKVRTGANVKVAYFDQLRDQLDLNSTLVEFISPGSEWIEIGGQRKHVMSYLDDFLFSTERAHSPVSTLSGGERNRLLLARLFARPANVLVLDEPTNDLDIDTLELLEQLLVDYAGTVLIVSHDRRFLDNVVTSLWVAEGQGRWQEYPGGITDWHAQRKVMASMKSNERAAEIPAAQFVAPEARGARVRGKLSFNEKRELDQLPDEIAALEKEQLDIAATLAAGEIYRTDPTKAKSLGERNAQIDDVLVEKMARWEALEAKAG
jgi:ABC transport system ATP-binding/permease protein